MQLTQQWRPNLAHCSLGMNDATYSAMKNLTMARSFDNNSSSQRRKRNIPGNCNIPSEHGAEAGTSSGRIGISTRAPSFTKVLLKTAHHSAYCCRLSLPRKFCEEQGIQTHVTMTDSTGGRRWHMRFQVRRSSAAYTISNGWREFSYDHSLEAGAELVFTLLSPSHFGVEFANGLGSTRAMHPTRDGGAGYPWFINYSRLACLSWKETTSSANKNIHTSKKTLIHGVEPHTSKKTLIHGVEPHISKQTLTHDVELPEERLPGVEKATSAQSRDFITNFPKKSKQKIPTEETMQFCQCKTEYVGKQEIITLQDSTEFIKKKKLADFTHLECKYADGMTYLQLFDSDSDSEIAD